MSTPMASRPEPQDAHHPRTRKRRGSMNGRGNNRRPGSATARDRFRVRSPEQTGSRGSSQVVLPALFHGLRGGLADIGGRPSQSDPSMWPGSLCRPQCAEVRGGAMALLLALLPGHLRSRASPWCPAAWSRSSPAAVGRRAAHRCGVPIAPWANVRQATS
jgi:hypothetical protein